MSLSQAQPLRVPSLALNVSFRRVDRSVTALVASVAVILSSCARSDFGSDPVGCPECRIVTERTAVIGDTVRDNALTGRPHGVWQDSLGRYWINVLDAFPMLYDSGRGTLET